MKREEKRIWKRKLVGISLVGVLLATQITGCRSQNSNESKTNVLKIERHPDVVVSLMGLDGEQEIKELPEAVNGEIMIHDMDLSCIDLENQLDNLLICSFNSKTIFSKSLPREYDPVQILEKGKQETKGLGVSELHEQGVTGKGVGIAIIDSPLLVNHDEYKDQLVYYSETDRVGKDSEADMHGTAVCSIVAGKSIGVAPDAEIYYIAENFAMFTEDNSILAEDIYEILNLNNTLPESKKIRVISISAGAEKMNSKGYKDYMKALQEAKNQGVFVITPSIGEEKRVDMAGEDIAYLGLSKIKGKEVGAKDSYSYAHWLQEDDNVTEWYSNVLCVPMDGMTLASPTGINDYAYYYHGGMSWSTPYLASVYVLACQVKPEITYDEFWKIAMDTADHVTNTDKNQVYDIPYLINVEKIIDALK